MRLSRLAKGASQQGVTLIEALAALAVLSAGLLAVSAMMTRALHVRVDDIQRIRAERLLADAGEIAAMLPAPAPLAANLTFDWQERANTSLPHGEGTLTPDTRDSLAGLNTEISWVSRNGYLHRFRHFYPLGPGSLNTDP